jgi:hypothetical protein
MMPQTEQTTQTETCEAETCEAEKALPTIWNALDPL